MTTYFLSRAMVRRDVPAAALWHELVPKDDDRRLQASHRLVWTLFSDTRERARDFLWREAEPGTFYLLSSRPPRDAHDLFRLDPPKEFAPCLKPGDALRFSLRANATVSRKQQPEAASQRSRGKPCDVVMDALFRLAQGEARAGARPRAIQQAGTAWLAERGAKCGFRLAGDAEAEGTTTCVSGYHVMRVDDRNPKMQIGVLDYEGVLIVEDPVRLIEAVRKGFGRSKAFGCGLMLIRRP